MTSQYIWIIYTLSSKISRQKSLKCDICESNAMKKFVKKRSDLIQNIIILRKCAKITLISSNFCDFRINYRINFRNFKVNFSTIEMKIKHFRANETIHLMQLIMRNDQTRKSCRQIYLCIFKKIIIIINKIEKIVAMIIIKSLKHLIKLNVIHVTKKNISSMIQRVLSTSNIKKMKSSRKRDEKSLNLMFVVTTLKLKLRKRKLRVLIWIIAIVTSFKTRKIKCLINLKTKKNFIL